jgi:hypothetical protein
MSAAAKDPTTWLPRIFTIKAGAIHRRDLSRTMMGPVYPAGARHEKCSLLHRLTTPPGPLSTIEPWRREHDWPRECKAQIIRALRRALFAHGDCGKRPGFPGDSSRDGGRMAQAGRRRSTPIATHANANEVIYAASAGVVVLDNFSSYRPMAHVCFISFVCSRQAPTRRLNQSAPEIGILSSGSL